MNHVILTGRLTADPEVRYTQGANPTAVANFTLAVDRRFSREEQSADFINCVVWGKLAEHVEKYYRKGMKTNVSGRIQTRNYTNRDGNKVYVTEVVLEEMEFGESKNAGQYGTKQNNYSAPAKNDDPLDGFMSIPDGIDETLPFH